MYRIVITDEGDGPSLVIGQTEAEAVACVVTHVTGADWSGGEESKYDDAWHVAFEELATPTTLEELDAWLCELHETAETATWEGGGHMNQAQVAQSLAQTTAPFAVEAYDAWLERDGLEFSDEDAIVAERLCDCDAEPCEFGGCDSHYPDKICQSCCKDAYGDCPIKCPKCGERVAPTLPFDYIERRTRSSCGPETTGHCGACGARWD